MSLLGRNAIVTGGSRGIGAQIAFDLAKEGANVLINFTSAGSEPKAEDVMKKIRALKNGARAGLCQADVGSVDIGKTLLKAATDFFGQDFVLHILIHNAGVSRDAPLEELTLDDYEFQMNINFRGPILITQAFLPVLKTGGGGRVVFLSSVSARSGSPGQSIYGATKAAVEHLTRCWMNEWGKAKDIKITAVNPGPIETDMWNAATDGIKEKFGKDKGDVSDVSDIVVFLCGDKARWINGSTINANNGIIVN